MLGRYKINAYRKPRISNETLLINTTCSQDHILSPDCSEVAKYLTAPTSRNWEVFKNQYLNLLNEKYNQRKPEFDSLAAMSLIHQVYLGCYCPTKKNPNFGRCHNYLALHFIKNLYPDVEINPTVKQF